MSKSLFKKIDWDVIRVLVLVWLMPGMLVLGAIFYPFFSSKY
ncbi:MAG: hypothetical protein RIQ37_828 [Actinomycetota bacterium]